MGSGASLTACPMFSASYLAAARTGSSFSDISEALLSIWSVKPCRVLSRRGARLCETAASEVWSRSLIRALSFTMASSHSFCPGALSRIDVTSFLIESDTLLLWLASSCQVGGSRGLTARDLAALTMEQDPSMMARPDERIGSWAALAPSLILAGWLANSGDPANVHRLSTASRSGRVAAAQLSRLRSL